MENIKIGDIVARKSYSGDLYFKVTGIEERDNERMVTLKGISYRIQADAPESDLILLNEYNNKIMYEMSCKHSRI